MIETVRALIVGIPLQHIMRIDAGLEGNWSGSVVTVWTRNQGMVGFERVARSHATHKPSLELYFDGTWVGIHCFKTRTGQNVFDEELATELIALIAARIEV